MTKQEKIDAALAVAFQYAGIDGAHHKQWVIDQMVRALTSDKYEEWVREYNKPYVPTEKDLCGWEPDEEEAGQEWDKGVVP